MANYVDFYLGSFLVLCGFGLALLNLRRIVKGSKVSYPAVLLSENILLTCIGIAFIGRSVYELNPINTDMDDIEDRSANIMKTEEINCNFISILMSYGPLIVSLVNSFLSLIIDNYMHYRMITDVKQEEDESAVRSLSDHFRENNGVRIQDLFLFVKKYFTFVTIGLQWILPVLLALAMYSINIKQMTLVDEHRSIGDSCMALLDISKENCSIIPNVNDTLQLRNNYLDTYEIDLHNISNKKFDGVVANVYKILSNLRNETLYYADVNVTTAPLTRKPKRYQNCMKICFLDNKNLLLYMFGVSVVSFFVPITISTIIMTKIHITDIKNKNIKTYVNRELLYNILFWTPVMFDTFLSIILCSYAMNGMRTSIFNVIANVYQAVKNFMNTKYFKDNSVVPV